MGRLGTTAVTTLALVAAGCQPALTNPHEHGGGLVDEYRPTDPALERQAPSSAEYVLWRWQPVPEVRPPAGELLGPVTRPVPVVASQWVPVVQAFHAYVHHGQPIGFRRQPSGLLVAVAGPTTRPLAAGRYCWHQLARDSGPAGQPTGRPPPRVHPPGPLARAAAAVAVGGLEAALVVGSVAAIAAADSLDDCDSSPSADRGKARPHHEPGHAAWSSGGRPTTQRTRGNAPGGN